MASENVRKVIAEVLREFNKGNRIGSLARAEIDDAWKETHPELNLKWAIGDRVRLRASDPENPLAAVIWKVVAKKYDPFGKCGVYCLVPEDHPESTFLPANDHDIERRATI